LAEDIIEKDIENVRNLGSEIESYVDRKLAHLDKKGWTGQVTYGDLKKIIEQFNQIVCKYLSLITAKANITLKPSIAFNWKSIFRVPIDIQKLGNSNKSLDTNAS
jgi:hypothetical protein